MKHHDPARTHYVGMGEVKVGARGEVLKATLGSCVGIAVLWEKGARSGLAHCLLPEAPAEMIRIGARYVSQAVPSLLALMKIKPADYPDVEVVIAGGARMLRSRPSIVQVGELNVNAARLHLARHGLTIHHVDVGGRRGRQITIDCAQHRFHINEIARQPQESAHDCA